MMVAVVVMGQEHHPRQRGRVPRGFQKKKKKSEKEKRKRRFVSADGNRGAKEEGLPP